jgi:membrane associated rhomboid family serine protease
MFPLRDVIPSTTVPFVTITLIVLNAIIWFFEISLSEQDLPAFLQLYGVVPADFAPATLITSMFLHGSWMHVIGNMWWLWIFGDNVEDRMGHGRFLVFYLLCGIVAALGQVYMNPHSTLPMVGASGAIAGVLGAYLVLYPHSRVLTLVPIFFFVEIIELPAVLLLGIWFVMQLFSAGAVAATASDQGGVAFMAHAAGFAVGALGVLVFRKKQTPDARWT